MSVINVCNGPCGTSWPAETQAIRGPAIVGARADGMGGGGMPSGTFHWCESCARVAFAAVRGIVRKPSRERFPAAAECIHCDSPARSGSATCGECSDSQDVSARPIDRGAPQ